MTEKKSTPFHALTLEKSFRILDSSPEGLSGEQAAERIPKYGHNEITERAKEPAWKKLLAQFANILIVILVIASIVSAAMGETVEAVSIIVIVLLAGILGFIQEYHAEKAIDSLKKMAAHKAVALRGGVEHVIESRMLVPGDVVILKTGDTIPADSRLVEAANLKVEESALTGESQGVEKNADAVLNEDCSIGDRLTMVFSGTSISNGRGKALVVATGDNTEFGRIAQMLQNEPDKTTPLQQNLDSLGSRIGVFAIIVAVIMGTAGVLRGDELAKMFVWGVALAVAVIPEALPAVVTISLALGVRRMVKRRALIRKLPAVETLGAINIICSDKTGTLTEDQMTIRRFYADGSIVDVSGVGYDPKGNFSAGGKPYDANGRVFQIMLRAGSLCNDSRLRKGSKWEITGDPTEGALVVLAAKAGLDSDELRERYVRIDEDPFTSEKKRMTTYHDIDGEVFAYSKGAGEIILMDSSMIETANGPVELTGEKRQELQATIESFAENSLRVIGIAYKKKEKGFKAEAETGMTLAGFVGMIDPPRPEAADAIKICEKAGIKPVMITGDHKITAVAIARELGILKNGKAFSGEEIERMTETEFRSVVAETDVFARISPSHKHKIVDALMEKGNIVAMTGDGVNDAPTLKKANIGVAMGITGTDVTKEASDMILTDDNFASIVSAVEEGRTIFENIRKYLVYLLSGNMGTVFGIVLAMAAGLPLPLTAVQILFINFVMDGLVAIALGVEAPEPGIMLKRPRNVREGILSNHTLGEIAMVGVVISLLSIAVYLFALKSGLDSTKAGTLFFVTLVFARLVNGFTCRSLTQSVFRINFFSNKALLGSIVITIGLVVTMVNVPVFRTVFGLVTLDLFEWTIVVLAPLLLLVFSELFKLVRLLKHR